MPRMRCDVIYGVSRTGFGKTMGELSDLMREMQMGKYGSRYG